jgi:hypothetical protein
VPCSWKIWHSAIRLACFSAPRTSARLCKQPAVFSGFGCPASGQTGVHRCSSSSRKPSLLGTIMRFAFSGHGRSGEASQGAIGSTRDSGTHPADEQRQSRLGSAAHSRRATQARHQYWRNERKQVHAAKSQGAVQTWRTFLENHVNGLVSVDFFTVPTIRFQVLYVFLVLAQSVGVFCISLSRHIQLRSGRLISSGKHFRGRAHVICCAIAIGPSGTSSLSR